MRNRIHPYPATVPVKRPSEAGRAAGTTALGALGGRLLRELGWNLPAGTPPGLVARAVREAEALAALTPYPQLLLPELAREKVGAASAWHRRQQRILERTSVAFAE
jgi:hypothetical protein